MWSSSSDLLGRLADGTPVFDRTDSHLEGHPEVQPLIPEIFARLSLTDFQEDMLVTVIDMGREVGLSHCVQVPPEDPVLYGWRKGRRGCSRFTRNHAPRPCGSVKIVLWRQHDPSVVVLVTAFVGGDVAPEPWASGAAVSETAHAAAVEFWKGHALIWDPELVEPSREVRTEAPDFWLRTDE
jgi:hypothetical protein